MVVSGTWSLEEGRELRPLYSINFISPPAGSWYDGPDDHPDMDEKGAVNLEPYDFRAKFQNPHTSNP